MIGGKERVKVDGNRMGWRTKGKREEKEEV